MFRLTIAQLIESGACRQKEVIKQYESEPDSLKRLRVEKWGA
jgi:hypothetical protein